MPTTRAEEKKHDANGAAAADEAAPGSKHKLDKAEDPEPKREKKGDDNNNGDGAGKASENGTKKDQNGGGGDARAAGHHHPKQAAATTTASAEEPDAREGEVPHNILEKGLVYFFLRGRVDVDSPAGLQDIARSYILLRPLTSTAAGLDDSGKPIGDAGNARLLALPKKVLPRSGRDRWTAFVEKAGVSFAELRDTFLKGGSYETKTAGERHRPPAQPVAAGVYAVTKTGRSSHLVYMLTRPEEPGELQEELGLREKGSFVINTKNPKYPGPEGSRLPKAPEYTEEVQKEFGDLRWMPSLPKHLDFPNTQIILIGESSGIEKATEPQDDQKKGEEDPKEELEKLEEEDLARVRHLSKSESERIFRDLEVDAQDFPKLETSF